jgi:ribosomal protein S19E (S16A)
MNDEFDFELTSDQWETLKALRSPATSIPRMTRFAVEGLVALGLVAIRNDSPVITPQGRKVLVRGSSRLLQDIAA